MSCRLRWDQLAQMGTVVTICPKWAKWYQLAQMGAVVTNSPKWATWYQIPQMGAMGRAESPPRPTAATRKTLLRPLMARTSAT